jgi:hypothetical protein
MTSNQSALQKVRRARFESQITDLMQERQPQEHQMMLAFAQKSDAFVQLRDEVIDHYYTEQQHLSPLFCVDAVSRLVQQVLATMKVGLQKAA